MKYFLHDTNAFQDEKVTELFMQFGYEGIGLFYTLLEKLAMQEKPMKTEVLKKQLFVGKKLEKVWNFMEEIELISSNNGETFNEQLLNFSEKYQIKKEKTREKVLQWRKNQQDKKNVTSYEPICNPPKVKLSKVKLTKDKNIEIARNFYSYELLRSRDKNYLYFIKFILGKNSLERPLYKVLAIRDQLTYRQFKDVYSLAKGANVKLLDIVESIENYNKKDYLVLGTTLKNWIKNGYNK